MSSAVLRLTGVQPQSSALQLQRIDLLLHPRRFITQRGDVGSQSQLRNKDVRNIANAGAISAWEDRGTADRTSRHRTTHQGAGEQQSLARLSSEHAHRLSLGGTAVLILVCL